MGSIILIYCKFAILSNIDYDDNVVDDDNEDDDDGESIWWLIVG